VEVFRVLAWLYLAIYVGVHFLAIRDGFKQNESRQTSLLATLLASTATTGFLLLMLGVRAAPVIMLWKFVAPTLVVGEVVFSIFEIRNLEREPAPGFSERENRGIIDFGSLLGILLMAPILLANLVFAYGRHLWPAV